MFVQSVGRLTKNLKNSANQDFFLIHDILSRSVGTEKKRKKNLEINLQISIWFSVKNQNMGSSGLHYNFFLTMSCISFHTFTSPWSSTARCSIWWMALITFLLVPPAVCWTSIFITVFWGGFTKRSRLLIDTTTWKNEVKFKLMQCKSLPDLASTDNQIISRHTDLLKVVTHWKKETTSEHKWSWCIKQVENLLFKKLHPPAYIHTGCNSGRCS